MCLKKQITVLFIGIMLSLSCAPSIHAHEQFIVPSHTLLSGDKAQSVTLIASISNAIFHPDRPLGDSNTGADVGDLKNLFNALQHTVIYPDGKITTDTRWQAFARLSVADVALKDSGTYRMGFVQPDLYMTTFKKANGAPARVFGPSPAIPDDATNVVYRTTSSRIETFVTFNSPTKKAVTPTGQGLELGGETHPNDLFANETANFQLFYNGKPLQNDVHLKVIKSGTRHRNDRNEIVLKINKNGRFDFTPTEAGFYFLAAEMAVKTPEIKGVDVKHYSLYLTLEVFPE